MELPEKECQLGYTEAQVRQILFDVFQSWMYGQTVGVCDGTRYNHEARQYEPTPRRHPMDDPTQARTR